MSYYFLLDVAMIIIATKLFGLLTRRIEMPQVVGALLAGLILGPGCLNLLNETDFLTQISEIGVIILMYSAGLETDISELKKSGKASFVIALIGVLVPLAGGFAVGHLFNPEPAAFMENIFIGVILTATSVSITVETLKEMGKLSTTSGNAILGAALIDDVLGIVCLTLATSMASEGVSIVMVLVKIIAFFAISLGLGYVLHGAFDRWMGKYKKDLRRFPILSFAFCLAYSFVAEEFFGVADITGAFIAGLIIANTSHSKYIAHRTDSLGYMFFTPVFFASIGLKVVIPEVTPYVISFGCVITLVAILSKVVGCAAGAKVCGMTNKESIRVGVGMVSRGEVALIIASKGISMGILGESVFTPLIIMVVVTTVITPILLKIAYKDAKEPVSIQKTELVDNYRAAYADNFETLFNTWLEDNNFTDYTKSEQTKTKK